MFRAVFIGWLIGKAIVSLVRGAVWVVWSAAYLIGAIGSLVAGADRPSFRKGSPF